jgi:DNA-binding transcriptional MerR regulator
MSERYTIGEAKRIACVSERQLRWWDISGAGREGRPRVYEPRHVFGALLFRELRERGFRLHQVRTIWRSAQRQGFELPDEARRWLLTDGERVVFLGHSDVVIAFLEQRRVPVFVLVSLAALAERMAERSALFARRGPGMAIEIGREMRQVREA